MMDIFDVSILVVTYNFEWKRLQYTLNSIFLQAGVNIQIVITDDGSADNCKSLIIDYFNERKFQNYVLNFSAENRGTVKNVLSGLQLCQSDLVKLISPGDCIYGTETLRQWVDHMHKEQSVLSFGKTVCYRIDDTDEMVAKPIRLRPQNTEFTSKEAMRRNYLIYNDLCSGSTVMFNRDVVIRYTKMIEETVIYAEDNVYRLMMFQGEEISYFNKNAVLYEAGGVSSGKSAVWRERLFNDWENTNKIMRSWIRKTGKFELDLKLVMYNHSNGGKLQWLSYLLSPGLWWYKYKFRKHPIKTPDYLDETYIGLLKEFDLCSGLTLWDA